MTTPGAPGEIGQDPPRHARARRTTRAASLDQDAARKRREARQKAPRPQKEAPRPRTFQEQRTAARTAARGRARARLATRAAGPTPEGAALFAAERGQRAARDVGQARLPTGNRQYQGVILAEFVTAALIVALAPIARGKAAQDKTPGPSPYGVDDIKQLAGIGAVYFVLALLSSGKWGRISAWFGGLVLVAIGLSETTSGGLPAIFGIFQPSGKSAGVSPADEQQIFNQAAAAAQAGAAVYPNVVPTPSGQQQQSINFTQPGVATTDELTPGVTIQQHI